MEKTLVRNKRRESRGDRIFYAVNLAILLLLAAIVLYPLYFIVIASISNADAVLGGRVYLYPVDIIEEVMEFYALYYNHPVSVAEAARILNLS